MPTRYKNYQQIEMAQGDPEPVWLLQGIKPRFADWSFAGGRPFNCPMGACERWHCGIDAIGARQGTVVVVPERCEIEAVDRGWSKGSKAVFARTETGLFLVFGGTIRGSGIEWGIAKGQVIDKGRPIGRVLGSYGMIHFETYVDSVRASNSRWYVGEEPPVGLLNPLNYLQRAAGRQVTLQTWSQIRSALAKLGYVPGDSGPWGQDDKAALLAAQDDLDLDTDGLWGPATEEKIRSELKRRGLSVEPPRTSSPSTEDDVSTPKFPTLPVALASAGLLAFAGWMFHRSQVQEGA